MNIYVGNLAFKLKEEDLQNVFTPYGTVTSVKIVNDRATGRSKGFGFVEMENDAEAREAINGVNGMDVMGRPLKVMEANPKN